MRRSLLTALAIVASLALPAAAAAEPTFLRQFGGENGKKPGQFALPDGIGVDNAGRVMVADSQNNRIQAFDWQGRVLPFPAFAKGPWRQDPGKFKLPYDVDFDGLGNIFVADTQNHRIQKFTPQGKFIRMWGRGGGDGTPGVGPGEMDQPRGLATDPFGNVWVADHENARVLKFDNDGRLLLTLGANGGDGSYGEGRGEFNSPRGICSDSQGFIYIADDVNHRIVKLRNDTGEFEWVAGKPGGPASGAGTGPGEFKLPYGCAADNAGNLWIADTNNHRVVVLRAGDGSFVRHWGANGGDGTPGSGPGEFEEPYNAGSDCLGNIYISDEHNRRVQVFGEPGGRRPVCPPGLTISGGAADLSERSVEIGARCDRICRVVARAAVRDENGRLVKLASRARVLDDTDIVTLVVRIPSSVAKRLERGARVSVRVTASGAPGADRVRPKTLKLAR